MPGNGLFIKSFGRLVKLEKGWSHAPRPATATIMFLQRKISLSHSLLFSCRAAAAGQFDLLFLSWTLLWLPFTTTFSLILSLRNNRWAQKFSVPHAFMASPFSSLFEFIGHASIPQSPWAMDSEFAKKKFRSQKSLERCVLSYNTEHTAGFIQARATRGRPGRE